MRSKLTLCLVLIAFAAAPSYAWHAEGHARAAHEAVTILPADLPEFFRQGAVTIEQDSSEPDLFTKPIAPPELAAAEAPEHYFDMELFELKELPADRYKFLHLLFQKDIEPYKIGLLPYALAEWTDRLAVAFAEHRKWPDDPEVQKKALVYAGILAHYAGDACMPLHTTIHHDGKLEPGKPAVKGIHRQVDALLGKLPLKLALDIDNGSILPADKLQEFIAAQLQQSHALVEPLYAMEAQLPAYEQPLRPQGPVFDFAKERLQASAIFIARLYATAWAKSKDITIPDWHHRPITYPKDVNAK